MREKEALSILRAAHERGLPSIVIGGNAIIILGYTRNTVDFDLLLPESDRSRWLDLLREMGYRLFHGESAFAQFEPPAGQDLPVDLMFVDAETWNKLVAAAREVRLGSERVLLPLPEHLVALKLHAASSPGRTKIATDWEDIRQIVRICGLSTTQASFRELVLRYGGEDALRRIEQFI